MGIFIGKRRGQGFYSMPRSFYSASDFNRRYYHPTMTLRQPTLSRYARALALLALLLGSAGAQAQLRLPSLPNLPLPQGGPLDTNLLRERAGGLLDRTALPDLRQLRLEQVGRLLRQHRGVLEADPRGEPIVRREILAWSPTPAALAAAAAAGLAPVREQRLGDLGETMVVLGVPEGADIGAVLERLRALDPDGSYDFNHIYTGSGGEGAPAGAAADQRAAKGRAGTRVGLVDSGVEVDHVVFRGNNIRRWGCDDVAHPAAHGTAVAALMVGDDERFHGAAPGAALYAADIYCDSPSGGSAERIAGALGWLAREQVAVINISLVGPPNRALERVVAAMQKRGHLLVAAVGNDGPAAPPLYPASYPGVVGVSAVDRNGRPLPEAARGPQVAFAAPGNNMVSAAPGAPPFRQVRGTSFAAPIVSALLAGLLQRPDRDGASKAVAALAQQAAKLDGATVSNAIGHGIVGAAFRIDPSRFR
jgi:subtilisin family serine protease